MFVLKLELRVTNKCKSIDGYICVHFGGARCGAMRQIIKLFDPDSVELKQMRRLRQHALRQQRVCLAGARQLDNLY